MWDDAELDRAIDDVARGMTGGQPGGDLRARVMARIGARPERARSIRRAALAAAAIVLIAVIVDRAIRRTSSPAPPRTATFGDRAIRPTFSPPPPQNATPTAAVRTPQRVGPDASSAAAPSPADIGRSTARDRTATNATDTRAPQGVAIPPSRIDALAPPPLAVAPLSVDPLAVDPLDAAALDVPPLDPIAPIAIDPRSEGDRR